jgi:PAS domain S-box-containing protein
MALQKPPHHLQFLAGGGEMGALTREKDWSNTSIGDPATWPQSLRTTVSIVLNSKFPMFLWWGPELTCFYNDAYRPSLGINGKHPFILGMPAEKAWPEIWEIIEPLIDQVLSGGGATWSEDQLIPIFRNGRMEDVYWTFSYSPVNNESGNVAGVLVTCNETTAQVQMRNQIKENELRFRLLADSMPQHIWTVDTKGTLNYFSQSVFKYSGLTLEQIDAGGWLQIVHPDDREENIRLWTEAIVSGNDFLIEHRFRRYDGEYRWQLSRAIPQRDLTGNIQMWVGTSTDIQDQKTFASELEKQVRERTEELTQLNESLAKSEQRYHLMVEEVEDYAILYLNRDGIIENWNKGAEKIKGYTAKEIIGKSFSVFYPEQERKECLPEKLLQLATEKGKAIHEGWRVRKDGSLFWASVAITAVHDTKNNVIGFSKVTHDLTERKAADDKLKLNAEQLEQKNKDLEKMNTELQSFAYVSSHDLQEPLRKIQTFASRILSKEMQTLSETGKDYFRRMQEAAGRMQVLIQDLLAYSRTNTTDRVFENINLADILNEVKIDIKETLTEKEAIIEVGQMCEINVIAFQFRQLLYNLIGNAIKFSKPNTRPHIRIESEMVKGNTVSTVSLSPHKTYCHISIADNGIGFDPQYKDRIFEVFQRLHGKEEYSGTGIGLAIVKKIVENHHGRIAATSELNKGATFDIYIPEILPK